MYLAQQASDPLGALLQYGVLGIFAAVLLWLARALLKREQDRADRTEQEVIRLNQALQDKQVELLDRVITTLGSATQAIQGNVDAVKTMLGFLTQIKQEQEIERELRRRREDGDNPGRQP